MKRAVLGVVLSGVVAGCSTQNVGVSVSLSGATDIALVDELAADGGLASAEGGVANRYLFVTSPGTNDLKVMNLYLPDRTPSRAFVRAVNPLESLSIPVLDRPSGVLADEGTSQPVRDDTGAIIGPPRRVTGTYVYAVRAGSAQISVVDATPSGLRVATPSPLVAAGPITAITAWLGHDLAALPDTTTLYYATYDGVRGTVFARSLPTAPARHAEIPSVTPVRVLDVAGEAVVALEPLPALPGRTVDGQPFCDGAGTCLVVATRKAQGTEGRTLLVELATLRTVPLAFPAPVRDLAASVDGALVYGILDEEACGGAACGGVLGIDMRTATGAGFPVLESFPGVPMAPLTVGTALPRSLSMAASGEILRTGEFVDGGVIVFEANVFRYAQLGFITASTGSVVPFDAANGLRIDYDGRRSVLGSAVLRIPGSLPDGGTGFTLPDGGANFTELDGEIDAGPRLDPAGEATLPYTSFTFGVDGGAPFRLELADGVWSTQELTVVRGGIILGLNSQPASPAQGDAVSFSPGLESRLRPGDEVVFGAPASDGGVEECGAATVSALSSGAASLTPVPAACAMRSLFTARARGPQPLVVSGGLEGFLGRVGEGETLTYTRPYQTRPDGFDGLRTSLVLTVGSMDPTRGALWSLGLAGNLNPFAFSIADCGQVPGQLIPAQLPTYINSELPLVYFWHAILVYPPSLTNTVVLAPLNRVRDDGDGLAPLSGAIGEVSCFQ